MRVVGVYLFFLDLLTEVFTSIRSYHTLVSIVVLEQGNFAGEVAGIAVIDGIVPLLHLFSLEATSALRKRRL